jgi:protein-disulfide isomerase
VLGPLFGNSAARADIPEWATMERSLGAAGAPVVMIEYFSLTCSHCATFHAETLPAIKEKYVRTGKVRLIVRDYPLDRSALAAAMLARCAPRERYFAFVDVLLRSQGKWARARDPHAALARIGRLGGVDEDTFNRCLASKALQENVVQSRLEATNRFSIESTPSFVINGKTYKGALPFTEFDRILGALTKGR